MRKIEKDDEFCCLLGFLLIFLISGSISIFDNDLGANAATIYDRYYDKAYGLMQHKKYRAAENLLNSAIKKNPTAIKLIMLRARLRDYYLKSLDLAIADYSRVIQLDGKSNPKAYYRRGRCFSALGLHQLAIRDYNATLAIKPDYVRVYLIRAKAYEKLGMHNMAMRDTMLFIKASPNDPQGHAFLKRLLNMPADDASK